ncbi:MAG: hypothetical protein R3C05_04335 [Pirellulaceae bacterium]
MHLDRRLRLTAKWRLVGDEIDVIAAVVVEIQTAVGRRTGERSHGLNDHIGGHAIQVGFGGDFG